MRFIFFIVLAVAVWYLFKATRRYKVPGSREGRPLDRSESDRPANDQRHENYGNAKDARYHDV